MDSCNWKINMPKRQNTHNNCDFAVPSVLGIVLNICPNLSITAYWVPKTKQHSLCIQGANI